VPITDGGQTLPPGSTPLTTDEIITAAHSVRSSFAVERTDYAYIGRNRYVG